MKQWLKATRVNALKESKAILHADLNESLLRQMDASEEWVDSFAGEETQKTLLSIIEVLQKKGEAKL